MLYKDGGDGEIRDVFSRTSNVTRPLPKVRGRDETHVLKKFAAAATPLLVRPLERSGVKFFGKTATNIVAVFTSASACGVPTAAE